MKPKWPRHMSVRERANDSIHVWFDIALALMQEKP